LTGGEDILGWLTGRKLLMPFSTDAIAALHSLHEEVLARTQLIEFQPHNSQHLVAMSLHGTLQEHIEAATESLSAGNSSAAFILSRSALEAFVDLVNIVECAAYSEHMRCAFLTQQKTTIKNALGRGVSNPYLLSIAGDKTMPAHLANIQDELQTLASRDIKKMSARQRFKRAGLEDLYEGPYAHLCSHSHNNLSALESRHLRQSTTGPEIWYFQRPTNDDVQLIVDTLAGILANSIANIVQLIEGQNPPDLPEIQHKLSEVRALWRVCR
jgi:hypothetical protein